MDVSIRPTLPPARDQGLRPTCLSFAISAGHAISRAAEPYAALSEEMLHQVAKDIGAHTGGISLDSAEQALTSAGQCRLELCPYEHLEQVIEISEAAKFDAATRKVALIAQTATSASIRLLLKAKKPVVLVLQIWRGFHETRSGVIATPDPAEILPGLHGVLATGLVHRSGEEYIEIRNSWGEDWGDSGYGYVAPDYIDAFCLYARVLSPTN